MNIFTFLTIIAGVGAIYSFMRGVSARGLHSQAGHRSAKTWMAWHIVFDVAVFVTILAAPLAR
jgi:hypothetical protein